MSVHFSAFEDADNLLMTTRQTTNRASNVDISQFLNPISQTCEVQIKSKQSK